jgi:hypothetical protein
MKILDNLLCKLGYHYTKNISLTFTENPISNEGGITFYCTNCGKKFFQKKIDLGILKYLQTIK